MRILHLIRGLDPKCGGPQAVLREIVRRQVDAGHDVAILTTPYQSERGKIPSDEFLRQMEEDPTLEGAEVVFLPNWGSKGVVGKYCYAPKANSWLKQRLQDRRRRPDIVHAHQLFGHLISIGPILAKKYGVPYAVSPHGSLDAISLDCGHIGLKRIFNQVYLRRILRDAALVHASSAFEAGQMEHAKDWIREGAVQIVPFGVELPQFDSEDAKTAFYADFPDLKQRRILLHLARIHPIKRAELIVEALPSLPADVLLFIAGNDSGHKDFLVETARRLGVEDRILFGGFLTGRQKQGVFEAAEAFVLPSQHENHGVVVLEALAVGLPAVVTRSVASSEHVNATGCGVTVDDTPDAIARGILAVMDSHDDACRDRAKAYVRDNLSWDASVASLLETYKNAVNGYAESS